MAYTKFNSKEELLNGQFNDNELHYVIVTDDNRAWAEHFAKQERDDSNNRKKIHVIGILTDDYYRKKTKDRSQTRIDKRLPYVHYFSKNNNAYPQKVVELITEHLEDRIRQEEEYMRTWALNNKYADKSIKRTTVTIYYDKTIEKKLADLYKTYKKKSRSAWLQVYPFSTFDSLVQSIQSREKSNKSDMKEVKNLTLRKTDGLFFKTQNSLTDPQASMLNGTSESSQNKKSVIASSLNNINRLTRSNENIILVANDNKELKNFQSFVSTQKDRNWRLWEIDPRDKDFNSEL